MSPDRQKTLAQEASFSGRGLFSGEPATVTISPAEANAGIHFIREQDGKIASIARLHSKCKKEPAADVPEKWHAAGRNGRALPGRAGGLGVDNALVRVSGGQSGELPAGDGSSHAFVELLEEAGLREQEALLSPFIIRKARAGFDRRGDSGRLARAEDKLEIIYDFEAGAPLGRQSFPLHASAAKNGTSSSRKSRRREHGFSIMKPGIFKRAEWECI